MLRASIFGIFRRTWYCLVWRRDTPLLWPMRAFRVLTSHSLTILVAVVFKFPYPKVYHRLRLWFIFQILNTRAVIAFRIFFVRYLSSLFDTQNLCYMESESRKKKSKNYFSLPSAYPELHKSCYTLSSCYFSVWLRIVGKTSFPILAWHFSWERTGNFN